MNSYIYKYKVKTPCDSVYWQSWQLKVTVSSN